MIWLIIVLSWKITKICTTPVLVPHPKQVQHSPKGVLFLLWQGLIYFRFCSISFRRVVRKNEESSVLLSGWAVKLGNLVNYRMQHARIIRKSAYPVGRAARRAAPRLTQPAGRPGLLTHFLPVSGRQATPRSLPLKSTHKIMLRVASFWFIHCGGHSIAPKTTSANAASASP